MNTYEWLGLIGTLLAGFWILAEKLSKMNIRIAQIEGKLWSHDRIKDEIKVAIQEHLINCPYKKGVMGK